MELPLLNRLDQDCIHLLENNRFLSIDNPLLKKKDDENRNMNFL